MSKGLEVNVEIGLCTKDMAKENPIKDFEILIEEYKDKWSKQMYGYFKECLSIIKKELEEYQHHEEILNDYGLTLANFREACLLLAMLKGEGRNIRDIDKQLKALEIIKEKRVDIGWLFASLNCSKYNLGVGKSQALKKKEYDLLKEVML